MALTGRVAFLRPCWKRQSRAASGRSTSRRVALVPQSGLKKAERSGAENEAVFSYFLWRRERSKETSTLTKPSPIWEGCNWLRGQAALRQGFGMAHRAFAPSGWAMVFLSAGAGSEPGCFLAAMGWAMDCLSAGAGWIAERDKPE